MGGRVFIKNRGFGVACSEKRKTECDRARLTFDSYTGCAVLPHILRHDLQLYLLGRLSSEKLSEIDSHLTGCNECGGRLVEVVRFLSTLAKRSNAVCRSDLTERRFAPALRFRNQS